MKKPKYKWVILFLEDKYPAKEVTCEDWGSDVEMGTINFYNGSQLETREGEYGRENLYTVAAHSVLSIERTTA